MMWQASNSKCFSVSSVAPSIVAPNVWICYPGGVGQVVVIMTLAKISTSRKPAKKHQEGETFNDLQMQKVLFGVFLIVAILVPRCLIRSTPMRKETAWRRPLQLNRPHHYQKGSTDLVPYPIKKTCSFNLFEQCTCRLKGSCMYHDW